MDTRTLRLLATRGVPARVICESESILVSNPDPGTSSSQVVAWDWRQRECVPVVYVARLGSGFGPRVRFVVLR
jgi:hypothetical protein